MKYDLEKRTINTNSKIVLPYCCLLGEMAAFPKLAILLTYMLLTVQAEKNMIGLCNPMGRMKFKKGKHYFARNEESRKYYRVYTPLQCYDYCLRNQGCKAFTFCLQKGRYSNKNYCKLFIQDTYNKFIGISFLNKYCISGEMNKMFATDEGIGIEESSLNIVNR